jgi:membrane protease YdiL (CAAX protease family)
LDDSGKTSFRVHPIWRLSVYVALVWILSTLKNILLERYLAIFPFSDSPLFLLAKEVLAFSVVYGAALVLSRVEKQPAGVYGLPMREAFGRRFWQGCILGLCEISVLIGLIAAFHGYSFGTLALHPLEILSWALEWAAIFFVVGLFEEFAYRGYSLQTLAEAVGFWPAALLLAFYFGFEHSYNPGESLVGEIGIVVIALLFALTVRRTGTLWLAVGWHAAFDFGETFLYSVPDSGTVFPGHLSNAALDGPVWLTGGATGPEGSVFSFVVMALLAIAVHYLFPANQAPPSAIPAWPLQRRVAAENADQRSEEIPQHGASQAALKANARNDPLQ